MADQEVIVSSTVVVVHTTEQREDPPVRVKMNKKAKLRAIAELRHGHNANLNIYDVPRKLLIFDVNKVLLFRQPKSPRFQIRPYAHEFIKGMSERYTIGVWTSMTKRFAVPILAELFPPGGPQLQFQWYQNRCRAVHGENKEDKPIFLKELHRVWGEHRMFNDSNTMLVDDSTEKCTRNAPWTSIHPLPYEPFGPSKTLQRTPPRSPPVWDAAGSTGADEAVTEGGADIAVGGRSPSPANAQGSSLDDARTSSSIASVLEAGIIPTISPSGAFAEDGSILSTKRPASPTTISSSATVDRRQDPREDAAEIDISDVVAQGGDAYRISVGDKSSEMKPTSGYQDCELRPDGPLWAYLDRIAQYDGHVRDVYDLCGPYKHSS